MPANNPITVPLPADLPTNWTANQTVGPNGADSGQAEQYGYNYLMAQVNAAQTAASELGDVITQLPSFDDIGGYIAMDTSIPAEDRQPNTLYGQNLADFTAAPATAAVSLLADGHTLLGDVPVGSTVKLNVDGQPTNFIVVNQGNPNPELYDESCNGTWLLMENIYSKRAWDNSNVNDYADSDIQIWLNDPSSGFLSLLDENIQQAIPQVKIPYWQGSGSYVSENKIKNGADGLPVKVFLLSMTEVGLPGLKGLSLGSTLNYFSTGGNSRRVAKYNGSKEEWWSRTPALDGNTNGSYSVTTSGTSHNWYCNVSYGIRPAIILNSQLSFVDDDGFVVTDEPPTAPGSIEVSAVVAGGEVTITLTAATDPDGTVESYIYERSVDGSSEWQQVANVNSLTQTDTINAEWGSVQYRACAVDNAGASGPYITSETYDVNSGWVIISGPGASLGSQPAPFNFSFSVSVTGQASTDTITVGVTLDGNTIYTGTPNSGETITLAIDTRIMSAQTHTLAVTASKESFVPAASSYTFTVPAASLPSGGIAQQPQDDQGNPVFFQTLGRYVLGAGGLDLNTLLAQMSAAALRIASGSYTGTGTSGSEAPNSLTFAAPPRLVLVTASAASAPGLLWLGQPGDAGGVVFTAEGNELSWYASAADAQLNDSGTEYFYIALMGGTT